MVGGIVFHKHNFQFIILAGDLAFIVFWMPCYLNVLWLFLTVSKRYFFCASFYFVFVFAISCSIVVTCWERADFFALLHVMFSCVFVTFPYGILGHVKYLIVSIPDLCLLPYFGLQCAIVVFPDHTHFFYIW